MIEKSRAAGASPEQIANEVATMERFMGSLQESALQLSHHFLRGALSHGIGNHCDFSCDPEETSEGSSRRRTTGQQSLIWMSEPGEANPIILYDGVCGLCNRLVQFLLKHDKQGRLRFASLQSEFAATVLNRHGIDPKDLDTVQVVINYERPEERVLDRSDAILRAGEELGMPWNAARDDRRESYLADCETSFMASSRAIVIASLVNMKPACCLIRISSTGFFDFVPENYRSAK